MIFFARSTTSSMSSLQAPVERYFQPSSHTIVTIVAVSSSRIVVAHLTAPDMIAPEERPAKRPTSVRRRVHSIDSLDRKVVVRPRESIEWTRRLTEVGLFAGLSSGAIMSGAVKCATTIADDEIATIVTIVCDDGWKYLSTGAWSDDIDEVVERAKKIIYF